MLILNYRSLVKTPQLDSLEECISVVFNMQIQITLWFKDGMKVSYDWFQSFNELPTF